MGIQLLEASITSGSIVWKSNVETFHLVNKMSKEAEAYIPGYLLGIQFLMDDSGYASWTDIDWWRQFKERVPDLTFTDHHWEVPS
jgi:hypothetical protein